MPQQQQIIPHYQFIVHETGMKLTRVKTKINRVSIVRILLFLIGVWGVYSFYPFGWWAVTGVLLATLVPFLALVKYHNSLFYKKEYLEMKRAVNEQELASLRYDLSSFDGGAEYIDPAHIYSYDLDAFGHNSLFQSINRTTTSFGKERLANWFGKHLTDKDAILHRQQAVGELAPDLSFRQRFRTLGLLYKGNIADGHEIERWINEDSYFRSKPLFRVVIVAVPAVNLLLLALGAAGVLPYSWLGFSFVFFVICNFFLQKSITRLQLSYEKKLGILSTYSRLIHSIENRDMRAQWLRAVKDKLTDHQGRNASLAVKQLSGKMNALNQRNNILVSTVLNGFLFWELRQVLSIEAWKEKYARSLLLWLEAIGDMDAICSLATFAYNHPDYTYPEILSTPFRLEAEGMGHPLMNRDKCVKNNVNVPGEPFFIVVTGANMAGKSTYLRTIGVNYLLACIGAPVHCTRMKLYPSQLITSLRTSDSLTDNESYFFAELKRLKQIIDRLNAGEKLFIVLDEILRGTNSVDKQKGSLSLIHQLMGLNAVGIIATHDLMLGTLIEQYPDHIRNYCFEADIRADELTFSYQLRPGVAQNMNACFLMNKMGIAIIGEE